MNETVNQPETESRKWVLRAGIESRISGLLEAEKQFDRIRYGGLDTDPSVLAQWTDRPVLDPDREPLKTDRDIRVILIENDAAENLPPVKSVQLHIFPRGEKPDVRQVYVLNLVRGESAKLTGYLDVPFSGRWGIESPPYLPYYISAREASVATLQTFCDFIDQGKPMSVSGARKSQGSNAGTD